MKKGIPIFVTSLLLPLMVSPTRAAECLGVTLPDTFQLGSETLVLNGLGARLATMLKVKVYVAGLYLNARSDDPGAIIATDQPRHLELHFIRDVDRKEITDAWTDGFKKNSGDKFASLSSDVHTLNEAMTDLPSGSQLTFSYQPGVGTTVLINDEERAVIQGADFASGLIAIWLGDPPNKEVKTGLLGGDCG
jgi:hypothetical protein